MADASGAASAVADHAAQALCCRAVVFPVVAYDTRG